MKNSESSEERKDRWEKMGWGGRRGKFPLGLSVASLVDCGGDDDDDGERKRENHSSFPPSQCRWNSGRSEEEDSAPSSDRWRKMGLTLRASS